MEYARLILTMLALPWLFAVPAPLSVEEFRKLAEELAPKVNLFHDVGDKDPEAEMYGGTKRDYLYWLKGKLGSGMTPDELRALPSERGMNHLLQRIYSGAKNVRTEAQFRRYTKQVRDMASLTKDQYAGVMDHLALAGGSADVRDAAKVAARILRRDKQNGIRYVMMGAVTEAVAREDFTRLQREEGKHFAAWFLVDLARRNFDELKRSNDELLARVPELMIGYVYPLLTAHLITKVSLALAPGEEGRPWFGAPPIKNFLQPPPKSGAPKLDGTVRSAVEYLTNAFAEGREIPNEDLQTLREMIGRLDPSDAKNPEQAWLIKNAQRMVAESRDYARTYDVLDALGLSTSALAFLFAGRRPLRSATTTEGTGQTAVELGIKVVEYLAKDIDEYRRLTATRDGKLNYLAGPENAYMLDAHSRLGERTGLPVRIRVDPSAREGVDFVKQPGDHIRFKTSDKLTVLSLTPEQSLAAIRATQKDLGASLAKSIVRSVLIQSHAPGTCTGAYSGVADRM